MCDTEIVLYQRGIYWVADANGQYTVYRDGATHATADSSYQRTPDGLSLAQARVNYLERQVQRGRNANV